jgi:hypothetical protein
MKAINVKSHWRSVAGVAGATALLFTVGCGTREAGTVAAQQQLTANQAGAPVVVSCEPHQRTVVRPTVVNGTAMSQVECVAAQPAAYTHEAAAPIPAAATQYSYAPARVARPVYSDYGDTQIVQAPAPRRTVARPIRTNQVVYDEIPARPKRSVKKSAIIIGSSAGVGAGVGAAVGGKKGALIGAAIGGGGAAVWDQITRR